MLLSCVCVREYYLLFQCLIGSCLASLAFFFFGLSLFRFVSVHHLDVDVFIFINCIYC